LNAGSILTTVITDSGTGTNTSTLTPAGAYFGVATFGVSTFGGGGTLYTRLGFDMASVVSGLVGRYIKVKFENVSGFRFGLEEYIIGVTSNGYQAEYV